MKEFFSKLWNEEDSFSRAMKIVTSLGVSAGMAYATGGMSAITDPNFLAILSGLGIIGTVGTNNGRS